METIILQPGVNFTLNFDRIFIYVDKNQTHNRTKEEKCYLLVIFNYSVVSYIFWGSSSQSVTKNKPNQKWSFLSNVTKKRGTEDKCSNNLTFISRLEI